MIEPLSDTDLVIFDCDGVLVDSEPISAAVLIAELARLGLAITPDYVRDHCLGRSFPTVARGIREAFAIALPEDFEQRYRSSLLARFATELRPTAGISALLARLRPARCVATSSSPQRVARSLEIAGLAATFGPDVFTASQVARGKPAPDLFLFAAERMRADPSRTLVIEDSRPGVEAAQAAGMRVLVYTGGGHRPAPPPGVGSFDNWRDFPQVLLTAGEG
ncbi:MAG: HAD family hydrolase [Rhodobacteraceae bacterium]|nr:HAD family hydrolase [Paracoccaceae bacterium]